METGGREAEVAQHQCQPRAVVARARKHQGGGSAELVQDVCEVHVPVLRWNEEVRLHKRRRGGVLGVDHDLGGLAERCPLQLGHLGRHGRTEEIRVPIRWHVREDLVELLLKVHGQHAVRLVHDKVLQVAEVEALRVLQMIDQPAGRRDHDVRLLRQRDRLRHRVHPTHDAAALEPNAVAQRLEHLVDLEGQLPSRRQDRGKEPAGPLQQSLQDGQRERARLPGSRLCQPDHIPALQGRLQGGRLDLRCRLPSQALHSVA
eukprot:scaffold1355_cov268-Pinguiococcus_pyrenoidosus.AAC.59